MLSHHSNTAQTFHCLTDEAYIHEANATKTSQLPSLSSSFHSVHTLPSRTIQQATSSAVISQHHCTFINPPRPYSAPTSSAELRLPYQSHLKLPLPAKLKAILRERHLSNNYQIETRSNYTGFFHFIPRCRRCHILIDYHKSPTLAVFNHYRSSGDKSDSIEDRTTTTTSSTSSNTNQESTEKMPTKGYDYEYDRSPARSEGSSYGDRVRVYSRERTEKTSRPREVVVHNTGGKSYDAYRKSDHDGGKWR